MKYNDSLDETDYYSSTTNENISPKNLDLNYDFKSSKNDENYPKHTRDIVEENEEEEEDDDDQEDDDDDDKSFYNNIKDSENNTSVKSSSYKDNFDIDFTKNYNSSNPEDKEDYDLCTSFENDTKTKNRNSKISDNDFSTESDLLDDLKKKSQLVFKSYEKKKFKNQNQSFNNTDSKKPSQKKNSKKKLIDDLDPKVKAQDLDLDLLLTDEELEYDPHSNPDFSRMTERQRAKCFDEDNCKKKLFELDFSLAKIKKTTRTETEEEAVLKKAETARRRLDVKMKALEDEKRDTINKLLKRRANKTRNFNCNKDNESTKFSMKPRRKTIHHKAFLRYLNSKNLGYKSQLSMNIQ